MHDLRRLHREEDCNVVTAITSVESLGPEGPVKQRIFFVGGLLHGEGLTDTKTKPPLGWRVSRTTLLNDAISAMIKDKWTKNNIGTGTPIFACCSSGIKPENLVVPDKDSAKFAIASSIKPDYLVIPKKDGAITIDWKYDNNSLEIRWTELPNIICRFTKAEVQI